MAPLTLRTAAVWGMAWQGSYSPTIPVAAAEIESDTAVSGTVRSGGVPVQGVTVRIGSAETTLTAADGSYTVFGVEPGTRAGTFSAPGYQAQTVNVVVSLGAVTIRDVDLLKTTTVALTRKPTATPSYGSTITVGGTLSSGNMLLGGKTVVLQSSTKTSGFTDTTITATTAANGVFSLSFNPTVKRYYRIRFAGDTEYAASFSGYVKVLPRVYITSPSAPRSMSRFRTYSIRVEIKPRQASGSYPVRIYLWRSVGGRWRSAGYVRAKAANFSSYTRATAKLRLRTAGRWRLRAYSPEDSSNAATWSGYTYVTVR